MVRRNKALMDFIGTARLSYHRPSVVAWWSAAFPGFGHMLLNMHVKGNALFLIEIIINVQSKLNLAMVYTFMGDFHRATMVLNTRWILIYIPFYFFCIWDSYRSAIDINKLYFLTENQPVEVNVIDLHSYEICYLDKRVPWVAGMWSLLLPGLGQFYARRLITSFSLLAWSLTIYIISHELQSIQMIVNGTLSDATKVIRPEWLLFMPSLIFGASYDAYAKTIEYNCLFADEQRSYLHREWQPKNFPLPFKKGRTPDYD